MLLIKQTPGEKLRFTKNNNNIDVKNDKMTVQEFIKLTQNSFGGDVIKQLAKEMKVKIEN